MKTKLLIHSGLVKTMIHFGRFLAAESHFSWGTLQTVNLLALRLQWFESTPAHVG